ncbi:uncharacterized protein PV06_03119 [Exophiala oligosperma]|uniref:HECT-type E3 ubiquitin transferase n=1 Tax=Exophiala oligosperma TaxID=215243 RepID=A0A0D2DQ90_9EURO|nr:uncharacterized protein PV06_03119 [Exophiala oligosperma]KIW44665.1 hypothetical protein PV06_03119 [Exophiala oligosperma]
MHYGKHASRSAAFDDSGSDAPDKQYKVKAADLGFDAPDFLLPDIIPISDSRSDYLNIHHQRDRRLRLLLRRFTNQIQYGCRNTNCSTPTCLSYRKRNSTGPLRKYTDLSARTLACQLLEDFSRGGKEPLAELCPNEPVVPWYEDPAVAKRRRASLDKTPYVQNGHSVPPKSPLQAQRARHSSPRSQSATQERAKSNHDGVVQAGQAMRGLDISREPKEISQDVVDAVNSQNSSRRGEEGGQERQTHHNAIPKSQTAYRSPDPVRSKDIASFTQTLFDLLPLRLLDWFPSKSLRYVASETHLSEGDEDEQMCGEIIASNGAQQDAGNLQSSNPRSTLPRPGHPIEQEAHDTISPDNESEGCLRVSSYSLRTLDWPTLSWLHDMEISNPSLYKQSVLPFFRQSCSYCLSHPHRLIRAVKNFQQSHPNPVVLEDHEAPDNSINTQADDTPDDVPKLATQSKRDLDSLLLSFALLEKFEQRDLVLGCILTALQHAYRLPRGVTAPGAGRRSLSITESDTRACANSRRHSFVPSEVLSDEAMDISAIFQQQDNSLLPLSDHHVAELCLIGLMSIASLAFYGFHGPFWGRQAPFGRLATIRNSGRAHSRWEPLERDHNGKILHFSRQYMNLMIHSLDVLDDWSVLRLLYAITDIISHRLLADKSSATIQDPARAGLKEKKKKSMVTLLVQRFDKDTLRAWKSPDQRSSRIGTSVIELLRTVLLKAWDRKPIVQRNGSVGGTLELLAGLYHERKQLNLNSELFHMPFIADVFDEAAMPREWLAFRADTRKMHLLSFSFLFEPATLVRYFRALNLDMMKKSYESATLVYGDARQYLWAPKIPVYGHKEILAQLRPHMARYFVLTVRRDNLLNDAINQIWRRQRVEIMRPLRVRVGKDEGEDGVDYGGVQQEFFRLVFAEAFDPNYGMFTIDGSTRTAWFQPGSFEPLYRFEALGILMSLAIYNGITLPVTFPVALYRKLLGLKVKKLDHIADGWPELTRGLKTLLEWSDGDVGDVIARTYEFSYGLCGSTVTVDMLKIGREDPWPQLKSRPNRKGKEKAKSTSFELPLEPSLTPPSQPSPDLQPTITPVRRKSSIDIKGISTPQSINSDLLEEAALVTNANREQYVKDYILWLTHKSVQPQYEAFARGFFTCLDRTALSIFTAEALKTVVEGHPQIDINELEDTVTYEGYERESEYIRGFWHVVRDFSPEQHKQLLEFVTASDRVPVNGLRSVQFVIQRNGDDEDSRLPSSSTCYGRLLLPMYSSKEILRDKLSKAIENSVGFGTL